MSAGSHVVFYRQVQLNEIEIVRTLQLRNRLEFFPPPFLACIERYVMTLSLHLVIMYKKEGEFIMDNPTKAINRRETLNIRIKPEERNLIDRAAKVRGKNRTDFILDAVRSAAEETLYNQTIILASPETYAKFLAQLDMKPSPNARLRKTMQTPAPWEKE